MTPNVLAPGMRVAGVTVARAPCEPAAWDAFVDDTPMASYTHLSGWRDVMTGALGHEMVQLVARGADGAPVGVLPLVWVRSALTGRYLVSMPFLNSGGPIGTTAAREALALAAADEARRGRADLMELRTQMPCSVLTGSDRKITVRLSLPPSTDALFKSFPSKLRSQIRRPQNAGCTVRFGARERDPFHFVYQRHMRDLGSPGLGRRVFDAIQRAFPDHVEFGVVYDKSERPVAAGCGFMWRDAFELVWAASLRDASAFAPNMLLYWSFMERSTAQGAHVFDFGRCTRGGGTHRFKQQWGGVDVPLPWRRWPAQGVAAPPTADRRAFRVASEVWKHLPVAVTRACGPSLARLIP